MADHGDGPEGCLPAQGRTQAGWLFYSGLAQTAPNDRPSPHYAALMTQDGLRPGDLVEVKSAAEIAQTLDADGMLDYLPFMAEMLDFCGRRFRVSKKAFTVCLSGPGGPYRTFSNDNVVTLDEVRCSGAAHDGCQKLCLIYWREEWLRKVSPDTRSQQQNLAVTEHLRQQLRPKTLSGTLYFCQATELPRATRRLTRSKERVTRYLNGFQYGNYDAVSMMRNLVTYAFWYTRRRLFGPYARGPNSKSGERLNLQPGEWVEVKPMSEIIPTLDDHAHNRGLYFAPDMRLFCGRKLRVKSRLDKMIADSTGEMKRLRNTVLLEGSTCGCAYQGLGTADCSRHELTYWRECWLRRTSPPK